MNTNPKTVVKSKTSKINQCSNTVGKTYPGKNVARWLAILLCAMVGSAANAATINITNNVAANAGTVAQGQSFTPSVNDGFVGSPATVYLTDMSVGALFGTFSYPDAQSNPIYLHIYSGFLAGPGNGAFGTPSGFLGVSNESKVWEPAPESGLHTLNYSFSSIVLNYATPTTYYVLFSTSQTAGAGLTARGTFDSGAASSYAGGGGIYYQGSHASIGPTNDMRFTAIFNTVPEPSVSVLFAMGGIAVLFFRRRQRLHN